MKTNFLGPAYKTRSLPLSCQTVINKLFEPPAPGSTGEGMFFQRPGLSEWMTIGSGPIRGGRTLSGYGWVVSGDKLYRISTTGASTLIGSVPGTGRVTIEGNSTQIVVMHSEGWHICTMSSLSYAAVLDSPKSSQGCYLGGRIIFPNDNGTYGWTELNTASAIDALNFASAESRTDPVVATFSDHRELLLFGESSIEWSQESGNAELPYTRTAISEFGLAAKHSIAAEDNTIFFLGRNENGDARVYRIQGYSPVGVSDYAIEYALKGYGDLSSAYGFCYQYEGHAVYQLTVPDCATWVYDISTQRWSQYAYRNTTTGELETHRAAFHMKLGDRHVVGDRSNNKLYTLESTKYTDNGDPLYWERTFTHLEAEGRNIQFDLFDLFAEMGVGLDGSPQQGTDPKVILSWSDDGGRTFPSYHELRLGKIGEYRNRARKFRLGISRNRVFRLSGADPVKTCLYGVNLSAKVLDR